MRHVLSYFPIKNLPIVGLLLFLILFTGVIIWVYRSGSDQFYKKMSELPLDPDHGDIKSGV